MVTVVDESAALPATPGDSWTPTPPGSNDDDEEPPEFRSCCENDDMITATDDIAIVATDDSAVITPEPLPFVLELPNKAIKKASLVASDISSDIVSSVDTNPPQSPPPKFTYSAQSCSEEDTPVFEDMANRTVGTVGFLAGLLVYLGCFCCLFNRNARQEIVETYNKHTLFSYFWPARYKAQATQTSK